MHLHKLSLHKDDNPYYVIIKFSLVSFLGNPLMKKLCLVRCIEDILCTFVNVIMIMN